MLELNQVVGLRGKTPCLTVSVLSLKSGEVLSLMGPNGAGKSTLLKVITGELPHKGRIDFHGRRIGDWADNERACHVGVLPQASELAFPFTAAEVVTLGLIPLSIGSRQAGMLVREQMRRTDSIHLSDRLYSALSGGERQRVHLARVMVQLSQAEQAPLLLLDEPTSAQDLGHQHQVLRLAMELAHHQGYAVLSILHDMNQAVRYTDRCGLLADGCLQAFGAPQQVLSAENIQRYWHYDAEVFEHPTQGRAIIL
ncbi:heme ABC transporter ATP-binding protein [Neptunomonas concharum]|uniref:Heme ABC transporter ATP-binding protein n=1 Tax=Neptunomonas concharum TaxID=1031538 RepID=A0A5P1RES9_9GAMM|nr:heme ABC transporter ATP-binding protein [Neptunomonas concharum]QEQ98150.1 heme ABC transporter ATP-binding protein [Neptunomonas concharum]